MVVWEYEESINMSISAGREGVTAGSRTGELKMD